MALAVQLIAAGVLVALAGIRQGLRDGKDRMEAGNVAWLCLDQCVVRAKTKMSYKLILNSLTFETYKQYQNSPEVFRKNVN